MSGAIYELWLEDGAQLNKNHVFNSLLDIVTSPDVIQSDASVLQCLIDMIDNGNKVTPKQAIAAISKKMKDQNPRTVILALDVLKAVFYTLGNTVYEVILSDDYMKFLKNIVYSTKHQAVKDTLLKILEDWARVVKCLPKYKASLKLIQDLQEEGYVSSKIQENSDANQKMQTDIELPSDSNNKQELLEKQLKERNERMKQKYREFRKANNLPTSSDEEDVEMEGKNQVEQIKKSNLLKNSEAIKKTLPKELESIKNQRLRLEANIREVRKERNQDNNCGNDLQQCRKDNCMDCEKYKKKPEPENVVITKQLPKVFQKIKQSRAQIKNSIEEVKQLKRQDYYKKSTSDQNQNSLPATGIPNGQKLGGIPPSEVEVLFDSNRENANTRANQEEDEDLRRALEISVYDTGNRGSSNPYEDDSNDDNDEEDLEQAINLSFQCRN